MGCLSINIYIYIYYTNAYPRYDMSLNFGTWKLHKNTYIHSFIVVLPVRFASLIRHTCIAELVWLLVADTWVTLQNCKFRREGDELVPQTCNGNDQENNVVNPRFSTIPNWVPYFWAPMWDGNETWLGNPVLAVVELLLGDVPASPQWSHWIPMKSLWWLHIPWIMGTISWTTGIIGTFQDGVWSVRGPLKTAIGFAFQQGSGWEVLFLYVHNWGISH